MSTKTLLTDPSELLHRQVPGRPGYVDSGVPTSLAFKPMPKDGTGLSVDRNSVHTAQDSYELFVASGCTSSGVWSVNVQECESLTLPPYCSPKPENPAHSTIEFAAFDNDKKRRKQAGKLVEKAIRRGCQWMPAPQAATPSPIAPVAAEPMQDVSGHVSLVSAQVPSDRDESA